MDKSQLCETGICDKYITPALFKAGWRVADQVYRQFALRALAWWCELRISSRVSACKEIDFVGAKEIAQSDFDELARKTGPEPGELIYPRYGMIGKRSVGPIAAPNRHLIFLPSVQGASIVHQS